MLNKNLTELQKRVMLNGETEKPFTGRYIQNKSNGDYLCANCNTKLFPANSKFDSKTGWPSFDSTFPNAVKYHEDKSLGMTRTEVRCAKCDIHLGHLFNDGPTKTGKRFCINDCTLDFKENKSETIFLGAGCFWQIEEEFRKIDGVEKTEVGYMGGKTTNPTYEEVCTNLTGHIEVTKIEFNPNKISVENILKKFWEIHNPTSKDAQGPDVGKQYRSVIFYTTEQQGEKAEISKKEAQKDFKSKIVTEIRKADTFYPAEDYHQHYLEKNGLNVCHI